MNTWHLIQSDLLRIDKRGGISRFIRWYFFPQGSAFRYNVWLRLLQNCKKKKWKKYTVGVLVYLIWNHYSIKYGVHVNANIEIGEGLYIVHSDGVFLNAASIGNNFTVYPGVMVGAHNGIPVIEDNVTIYTGAVVTGGITLHSGSTVAANAYVGKDVPNNTTVAGLPARPIKSKKNL